MRESLRLLLSDLIDYAGLFPPAELSMTEAVGNFARYRSSEHARMLGRFILPLARLGEFHDALAGLPTDDARGGVWHLSVLGTNDLRADLERIAGFNHANESAPPGHRCEIVSLEIKTPTVDDIREVARFDAAARGTRPDDETRVPAFASDSLIEFFCEITPGERSEELIAELSAAELSAKVRTGGVTADAFPTVEQLARFIHLCARYGVAFKATAGLHHPLRAAHRLTYKPDSPSAIMHGFLNVFIAAVLAHTGADERDIAEVLRSETPSGFDFGDDAIRWRDHRLDRNVIEYARARAALSFGSCSFTEPTEDLAALNLL